MKAEDPNIKEMLINQPLNTVTVQKVQGYNNDPGSVLVQNTVNELDFDTIKQARDWVNFIKL